MSEIRDTIIQYGELYGDEFEVVACIGLLKDGTPKLCLFGHEKQLTELLQIALDNLEVGGLSKIAEDA